MLFGKHVNKFYIKYGIFFLIGIAALILVDYFQLEIPDIIGEIIDSLQEATLTPELLKHYSLSLIGIGLIMFFGRFLWRVSIFGNGVKIESDLRNELFYAMQQQSLEFFQENKTGALMTLYTNDITMIRRVFGMGTIMIVDSLCLGVLTLYKMIVLNWRLSLFCLVALVVVTVIGSIAGKKIKKASDENFDAFARLSDYVQEDISGIGVVKAFVKEKLQISRFQKYNQENMDSNMKLVKLDVKVDVCLYSIVSIIFISIIVFGGFSINAINNGREMSFSLGDLTRFIAYFDTLIWPIEAIGRLIRLRSQGKASLDRITRIIDRKTEINDDLADPSIKELKGKIEFRHLNFQYPLAKIQTLHDVSFTIAPGEFVGVIGKTGSGKSAITELLLRLYNTNENELLLDDVDIMKIPLKTVREGIAYAPQDNFLFSTNISDNIAFSDINGCDQEKVEFFANMSDVDKDVKEFSDGYNTVLGERGVTVSGGQKQRIAIARALYKDANILILDDSLSAVDTETEKTIINSLRELRKGMTTIIIAHRISTLQYLDKILVVEGGTVTGCGTHEELLKTNKAYSDEVRFQELEKEAGITHGRKRK